MEDFYIKRFIKGLVILIVSGLVIGVGRGAYNVIHTLNIPHNVYNENSIQVEISPRELAHGSYTYADNSSSISYQLSNDMTSSFMPFSYLLFDEERRQVVDDISSSTGHDFKWLQIGAQRLPISKIQFTLIAESNANIEVYLVSSPSYSYGIPEENQAEVYEFAHTNNTYLVEIPRLYLYNNRNQWTYASFYSVVIALENGETFTLKDVKFSVSLQRTSYDDSDTLIK